MGILPGIAKANGRITNEFLYDAEKDTALAEPDSNRKIRAIIQLNRTGFVGESIF